MKFFKKYNTNIQKFIKKFLDIYRMGISILIIKFINIILILFIGYGFSWQYNILLGVVIALVLTVKYYKNLFLYLLFKIFEIKSFRKALVYFLELEFLITGNVFNLLSFSSVAIIILISNMHAGGNAFFNFCIQFIILTFFSYIIFRNQIFNSSELQLIPLAVYTPQDTNRDLPLVDLNKVIDICGYKIMQNNFFGSPMVIKRKFHSTPPVYLPLGQLITVAESTGNIIKSNPQLTNRAGLFILACLGGGTALDNYHKKGTALQLAAIQSDLQRELAAIQGDLQRDLAAADLQRDLQRISADRLALDQAQRHNIESMVTNYNINKSWYEYTLEIPSTPVVGEDLSDDNIIQQPLVIEADIVDPLQPIFAIATTPLKGPSAVIEAAAPMGNAAKKIVLNVIEAAAQL